MRFHKNLSVSSSDESREAIRRMRGCSGLLLKIQWEMVDKVSWALEMFLGEESGVCISLV